MTTRRSLMGVVLVVAVVAAFWPGLSGRFVNWDDGHNFLLNPRFRGFSGENLRWIFTNTDGHYIPLTWLTLALDYTLWGMDPAGYHATSLALHAANALLLFRLLMALLPGPGLREDLAACGGAMIFALHPLRAESVSWITERRDLVYGLFLLLSTICYLRAHRSASGGRWKWLAGSVALYAGSLLGKGLAITFPAMLIVLDLFVLDRRISRSMLLEKVPFALLGAAGAVLVVVTTFNTPGVLGDQYTWVHRLTQPGFRLSFYVWKTAVPLDLSPLYLFRPSGPAVTPWVVAGTLISLLATLVLIAIRRRAPLALGGWLLFAIALAPTLGLAQAGPHYAADRYTYVPGMIVGGLMAALLRISPRWILGVGSLGVLALGTLTWRQSGIWSDSLSLWNHAVRIDPTNYFALNNRADSRLERGDLPGVLADCDASLALNQGFPAVYFTRGAARYRMGKLKEALEDFDVYVRMEPALPDGFAHRAFVRLAMGNVEGAGHDAGHALKIDPGSLDGLTARGLARQVAGDLDGAIADFDAALRNGSGAADGLLVNRAMVWKAKRNEAMFLRDIEEALRINPRHAPALRQRGTLRLGRGDLRGGVDDLTQALTIDPSDVESRANRGAGRYALGDRDGARADLEETLRRAPAGWPARRNVEATLEELRRTGR